MRRTKLQNLYIFLTAIDGYKYGINISKHILLGLQLGPPCIYLCTGPGKGWGPAMGPPTFLNIHWASWWAIGYNPSPHVLSPSRRPWEQACSTTGAGIEQDEETSSQHAPQSNAEGTRKGAEETRWEGKGNTKRVQGPFKPKVPQLRNFSSHCVRVREPALVSPLLLLLDCFIHHNSSTWSSISEDGDTKVATVPFEDMASNAFAVTITRVQQEALKQAGCKVPTPSEQLALVAERRAKKTETTRISIWRTIFFEPRVF